jgi:hypothetical protein
VSLIKKFIKGFTRDFSKAINYSIEKKRSLGKIQIVQIQCLSLPLIHHCDASEKLLLKDVSRRGILVSLNIVMGGSYLSLFELNVAFMAMLRLQVPTIFILAMLNCVEWVLN